MGIGNKLSALLEEREITASELARKINVAPTTVYSIIQRNNKKVDIDVLLNMADVLGVDATYFRDTIDEHPTTIAAHLDAGELTQDELDDVADYIEFIKNKRKK